jgi:hypothetical protein
MPTNIEAIPQPQAETRTHDNRKLCTHIFAPKPAAPVHVCGSPALRGQAFCYFHHPTYKRVRNPSERRARRIVRQSFALGAPTNPAEFQLALNEVIFRLAANEIDTRRAGLLLFGLQIAGRAINANAQNLSIDPMAEIMQMMREG